jgi:hopanoid biosynthesis associated protein HpnK
MKRLIITGDDFGYSRSTNEAIARAHREGFLTSASLMPCGYAFEHAVELARQMPTLSVGVHFCLLQARAILPHDEIPALTNRAGDFHEHPILAGLKFFITPCIRGQIERELRAQMAKFLATGLRATHINTHMHLHAHPLVFPIVAQIGREHGIRWLRVPRENLAQQLRLDRRHWVEKLVRTLFFGVATIGLRKKILRAGLRAPDTIHGLLQTGHMDEAYLAKALPQLKDGLTEIYFHPGRDDDPVLRQWQTGYDHAGESAALLSQRLKQLIQQCGIQLGGFESGTALDGTELLVSHLPHANVRL